MTTNTNPEGAQDLALELADALERMSLSTKWDRRAATELRRLHARVQELEDAWNQALAHTDSVERAVEAEREACAMLAERRFLSDSSTAKREAHRVACQNIAAAIRARGAKGEST